ncbi:ribonuclease III domain-containing protein [Pisolithus microcarpus]|nr:ribonuclease III domain-containing protein [Pisolithus microcarpus]
MQRSDKGCRMYDKENHDETSGGRIHRPSEKQQQLVDDQHEATRRRDAKARRERAHEHLRQLANIRSENEGTQDEDDNDQGIVDEDHDDNSSGDTLFTNRIVPTRLSGGTKQPLAFHNNKVPKTPRISASAIEALEALMDSDRDTDDEYRTISSSASIKQKRMKDKRFSRNVRRVYTALRPEGRLLDVDAIRTQTAPVGSIIPQGACRRTHFSEGVYWAFLFLPCLCRCATDVYRARKARFQLGLPPIADDLLIESTALPTTNANWNLETLGDSVLKLITTVHITNKCPHRHEGQLSQLRQSSMSNRALLARATEIERFLTSEGQNIHVWRYMVPEGEDVLSHMLNSYHAVQRSFPRRSLQDCMEAMLGAAFLTGGIELNIVP